MAKDEIKQQIEDLKNQGKTVYSISRLNSFNSCEYGYHLTYNKKLTQVQNPYSILGGVIHDCLEGIYNGECDKSKLIKELNETLTKCELFGVNFPTENIKRNWNLDMAHFANNFKKLEGNFITEKGFVFDLDGILIQGFIDAVTTHDDKIDILDWKTSSMFTGDKLKDAGRQLLLYKMALENLSNIEIDKIGWDMLKYVKVNYGNKSKVCARRNWVKDISKLLATDLKKLGIDSFIANMYIEQSIKNNNLECMPTEIKGKYIVNDCIMYYEPTEELINECVNYITKTVAKIESKNKDTDEHWQATDINAKTLFFCKQLCGQRENCEYLKRYERQSQ